MTMHIKLLLWIFFTCAYSAKTMTRERQNSRKLYTCHKCDASGCRNPLNKTCKAGFGCFTSISLFEKTYLALQRGCLLSPFLKLAICNSGNGSLQVTNCCFRNFCNIDEFPSVPDHWYQLVETKNETIVEQLDTEEINLTHVSPMYYILPVSIVGVIVCFVCFFSIRKMTSNKRMNFLSRCYFNPYSGDSFDNILTLGSRSSLPTLNQRYMFQNVTLIKMIGQGRFGEVWQGLWHGENVAVKIFSSTEEASWQNEVNIYTNIALFHENLLGFKGSVIGARQNATEMWLLTAFHERGSLYDFLSKNTITHDEMIAFVRSICSGLLHLHTEFVGSKGKPSIAHRDLKSRNILLTSHGTCVIADFGLAIVQSDDTTSTNKPINYRVGTKRYMAPEILDDSMRIDSFDSFKRADIYAYGLILWEVCSRCIIDGKAKAYRPPYDDCVPNNPDFEDMKKAVCIELKRPEVPKRWLSDKQLSAMAVLMKECWHKNPEIRPTVCRVKKILDKMHTEMQEPQLDEMQEPQLDEMQEPQLDEMKEAQKVQMQEAQMAGMQ